MYLFSAQEVLHLSGLLTRTIWLIKVTLSLNLFCTLLWEFSHSLLLSLLSPADVFTRFFIVLDSFYHHQSIPPPGHLLKQKGKTNFLYLGWNDPNWNEPGVTPGIAGSHCKGFDYLFQSTVGSCSLLTLHASFPSTKFHGVSLQQGISHGLVSIELFSALSGSTAENIFTRFHWESSFSSKQKN